MNPDLTNLNWGKVQYRTSMSMVEAGHVHYVSHKFLQTRSSIFGFRQSNGSYLTQVSYRNYFVKRRNINAISLTYDYELLCQSLSLIFSLTRDDMKNHCQDTEKPKYHLVTPGMLILNLFLFTSCFKFDPKKVHSTF